MTSQTFRNQPRRSFSRAFKKEVVELLLQDAATVAEVAREYDLHPNLLCRWRSNYLRGHYAGVASAPDDSTDFLAVTLLPADDQGDMATAVTPVTAPEDAPMRPRPQPAAPARPLRCPELRVVLARGELVLKDCDARLVFDLLEALR